MPQLLPAQPRIGCAVTCLPVYPCYCIDRIPCTTLCVLSVVTTADEGLLQQINRHRSISLLHQPICTPYRMGFAPSSLTCTSLECFWLGACCAILSLAVAALGCVRQMNTTKHLRWILLVICSSAQAGSGPEGSTPSPTASRSSFTLDWCDCGTGLSSLKVWPDYSAQKLTQPALIEQSEQEGNQAVTIKSGNQTQSLRWTDSTNTVHWLCDGMNPDGIFTKVQTKTIVQPSANWVRSLLLLCASHCLFCLPCHWSLSDEYFTPSVCLLSSFRCISLCLSLCLFLSVSFSLSLSLSLNSLCLFLSPYRDKGIESIRARTCCISLYLSIPLTTRCRRWNYGQQRSCAVPTRQVESGGLLKNQMPPNAPPPAESAPTTNLAISPMLPIAQCRFP